MDKAYLFEKTSNTYREYLNRQHHKDQKATAGRQFYKGLFAVVFCMFTIPLGLSFLFGQGQEQTGYVDGDTVSAGADAIAKIGVDGDYYVSCVREIGEIVVPMDEYLVSELVRTMGAEAPGEALQAMAVLLRTQVIYESERHGGCRVQNLKTVEELQRELGVDGEVFLLNCVNAVRDTAGIIMTYEGAAAELTYHMVSAGSTRNGSAIFGDRYPYLQAVVCDEDLLSPDYRNVITFSQRDFFERLRKLTGKSDITDAAVVIEERDEAGYVLALSISGEGFDSMKIGGETFRMIFDLPSANFTIEEREKEIAFICNGAGHGFGMSLYQAEHLARDGSSFMEILNYFFSDMTFMRIA